jgi:hypothetical protein
MSPTVGITLFAALFVMLIVWMVSGAWIHRRLRLRHSLAFQAIGSPGLFFGNGWLFLKFLFGSQWQNLGDRQLTFIIRLAQVTFVLYVIDFIVLFVAL